MSMENTDNTDRPEPMSDVHRLGDEIPAAENLVRGEQRIEEGDARVWPPPRTDDEVALRDLQPGPRIDPDQAGVRNADLRDEIHQQGEEFGQSLRSLEHGTLDSLCAEINRLGLNQEGAVTFVQGALSPGGVGWDGIGNIHDVGHGALAVAALRSNQDAVVLIDRDGVAIRGTTEFNDPAGERIGPLSIRNETNDQGGFWGFP